MLTLLKHLFLQPAYPGRRTTYQDRYLIASMLSFLCLPLPFILKLFGSDKEKAGEHSYGATYAAVFAPYRFKAAKILEIGLLAGDSLLAWRCYFPRATVVGADIEAKPQMAGGRTRIYTVDQSAAADLDAMASQEGPFDIIIDDGSHVCAHQIFTFYHLFDRLKDGGVYVIEDVQTSFWSGVVRTFAWDGRHISDPRFCETFVGEALELAKYVNHAEFQTLEGVDARRLAAGRQITRIAFEHNLVFVWKGDNSQKSNYVEQKEAVLF